MTAQLNAARRDLRLLRSLDYAALWREAMCRMLALERREGGICDHATYRADGPLRRAVDELNRREEIVP